jgi:hypothetical protein
MRALSSAELIALLATMPKPLECEATSTESRIYVRCVPASPTHATFSRLSGEETARRLRAANDGVADLKVLVTGAGHSIVVPLHVYEIWHTQYYVFNSADEFEFDPAPPEAAAVGAHMLLTFASPR